ncbi:MAG: HAMP domain-containing protein, partial [Actinobacteria bacterium]|nr:HAMP domain-containing protein [Actinomycetota bacterium]
MRSGKKSEGFRRQARLKLSFQIAAIAVIIFFFASMAGFILFRSSLNNLTQNSKDRFLESISTLVSSSQSYNSLVLTDIQVNKGVLPMTSPEFFKEVETAIQGETVTPTQETGNDVLKSSAENGILGISLSFYALPPQTAGNTNPLIIITSDEDYMYRELPPEIAALMDKGGGRYKLFEGGIPGMGLDEEYLVSAYEVPCDNPDQSLWYFTFKPMGELIAGIDGFLSDETGSVYLVMILVMSLSTLGLLAISILIMGYLLNRRIAKPIGELSRAAEQVMEGDLDIRVEIRPREEFIELKTAFNKITSSLSRIITLAMEEGPESARSVIREEAGREKEAPAKYMKPRSTILIQITAMFIVIFIISGLVGLLAVNRTMNNMIN